MIKLNERQIETIAELLRDGKLLTPNFAVYNAGLHNMKKRCRFINRGKRCL